MRMTSNLQIFGHRAAMESQFWLGNPLEAREQGKRVLALDEPRHAGRWMQLTGQDLRSTVGSYSSHWTWMLGYPDQAVRLSDETDARARRLGHAFNLAFTLVLGADTFDYRREPERLVERAREADRLAREQSIPIIYQVSVPRVTKGFNTHDLKAARQILESLR